MLWLRSGGAGNGPVLLLLHGLGGTADLWQGVIEEAELRWPGPWIAPDLIGHGRSRRASLYEPGDYAAAVADTVAPMVGDAPVVALGHSLGGAIGLTLATGWFGLEVAGVVGVGIKTAWTTGDLEQMAVLRAKPPARFATRDQAAARFVLVNGLAGVLDPASPLCDGGVTLDGELDGHGDGGAPADRPWRLAHDPASFPDFVPSMDELVRLGHKPVVLARGETDTMVSDEDITAIGVDPMVIAGAGHNAHVERPAAVLDLALGQGHR